MCPAPTNTKPIANLPAPTCGVAVIYPPFLSKILGLTAIAGLASTETKPSAIGVKLSTYAAVQATATGALVVTFRGSYIAVIPYVFKFLNS